MRRILKYSAFSLLVVVISGYLYIFRDQEIELTYFPSYFEHCDTKISGKDHAYLLIREWLTENNDEWVHSFVSFAHGNRYFHPAFKVNILENVVIVSYKTDYGYPQFIKQGKHNLALSCGPQLTN